MQKTNELKKLFIIGAGDFGREMESWLTLLKDFNNQWMVCGYLDDNINALEGFPSDYKVLGKPLEYSFAESDYVLMCVTNPAAKKYLTENLKKKVNFFTYIAPTAIIGKFAVIGMGSIISSNSIISTNTIVEEFVTINSGSQIGHDCKLGAYSSLMASVDLGGYVKLGERVFIGTNATIIPRKIISDGITIGAGSIVIRNLKKEGSYFGNPASLIQQ